MYIGKTRGPIVVLLLSLVTCGIYMYFWYYTVMNDINNALGEERMNPVMMLVLCIVCPPVLWYVLYKVDKGLAEVSMRDGVYYKENFIMWLILTLVCGIGTLIGVVQIQGAFNNLWAKRSAGGMPPPPPGQQPPYAPPPPPPPAPPVG